MRSRLTRDVFRRILANEPIVHPRCLHRHCQQRPISSWSSTRPLASCNTRPILAQCGQQRGIGGFNFNIFTKRQQSKEADMEAGIDKMMELAKRERMQARMPPLGEVALALQQLFQSKVLKKSNLTDTEAQLALQSLRYVLLSFEKEGSNNKRDLYDVLPESTIRLIVQSLRFKFPSPTQTHVELVRLLYDRTDLPAVAQESILHTYSTILSRTGHTTLARDLILHREQAPSNLPPQSSPVSAGDRTESLDKMNGDNDFVPESDQTLQHYPHAIWRTLLTGFVNEGKADEVKRTLATVEERNLVTRSVVIAMMDFSREQQDVDALKKWWTVYMRFHPQGSRKVFAAKDRQLTKVLTWCLANGHLECGHEIVRDTMAAYATPPKPFWDAIFIWAAGTRKSVDEIGRMIKVMEDSNTEVPNSFQWRHPDINTINGLVEYAVSINDPYMAERFIGLGRERNIQPDARTCVLQMEYRLNVKDTDGALVAYTNLQSHDTSSEEDVSTVNRLIVALCQTNRHDFETIMNVVADLTDRRAHFEAGTVAALSILHLTRAEEDDVIDLLNTHAFFYSSTDRASLRNAILAFCLVPNTPTGNAWMGYTVLRDIFDELSRTERTQLMNVFFNRKRPDMAVHVFQNMRRHSRADTIPTNDTYVSAFMGLAEVRELEGLEVVHNQLKLDYNINPNTYLYNALIIAYTACGKARNALAFWEDIVASREGPTYNSIHAALRACEKDAWGDERAKRIWDLLRKRNVDLDESIWASYLSALAGNGALEIAIKTLEEGAQNGEVDVDWYILGSLHYVTAGSVKQADVETFAREKYPTEWEKLEAMGMEEDDYGSRRFKIDRKIGP